MLTPFNLDLFLSLPPYYPQQIDMKSDISQGASKCDSEELQRATYSPSLPQNSNSSLPCLAPQLQCLLGRKKQQCPFSSSLLKLYLKGADSQEHAQPCRMTLPALWPLQLPKWGASEKQLFLKKQQQQK